jgi:molybdate transport system regulatory protein
MPSQKKNAFSYKIWMEQSGKPLIGIGGADILEQIDREKSISRAAMKLGMSYRYVWNYLKRIDIALGEPIVETFRGGRAGGGGTELTDVGATLLREYRRLETRLAEILDEKHGLEVNRMRISARNQLTGKVVKIEKEGLMAKIKVEITLPATVTAMISKEAAEDLGIKVGDNVEAIIKATEVMIAK